MSACGRLEWSTKRGRGLALFTLEVSGFGLIAGIRVDGSRCGQEVLSGQSLGQHGEHSVVALKRMQMQHMRGFVLNSAVIMVGIDEKTWYKVCKLLAGVRG